MRQLWWRLQRLGREGPLVTTTDQTVVCEVLRSGEVISYEASIYDAEDAADFVTSTPAEDRNFFLATFTLTPLQEN